MSTLWNTVALVSSGVTLVAFIAAVALAAFRQQSRTTERLIRTAKEQDRARLVEGALKHFPVVTDGLTKEQKYTLVLQQVHAHAELQKRKLFVVCFVATLSAIVALFAIERSPEKNGAKIVTDSKPSATPSATPSAASKPSVEATRSPPESPAPRLTESTPTSAPTTQVVTKAGNKECLKGFDRFLREAEVVASFNSFNPKLTGPVGFGFLAGTEMPLVLPSDPIECRDAEVLAKEIKSYAGQIADSLRLRPGQDRLSAYEDGLNDQLIKRQARLKKIIGQ